MSTELQQNNDVHGCNRTDACMIKEVQGVGHKLATMMEGGSFVTAQTERGGGGAVERGQRMQDAKKVEWLPTSHCPRS